MSGRAAVPLSRVGEDALVRLFSGAGARAVRKHAGSVVLGPGDDAAVLHPPRGARLLLTTDLLAEGIHFRRSWARAEDLGWKLLAVNASDIAAMGGRPLWALVAVALPPELDAGFAAGLTRGLHAAARRCGCAIVGGDTCAADGRIFLSLVLAGAAGPRLLTRAGARDGDLIFVTGHLGASVLGLAALERHGPDLRPSSLRVCARRQLHPVPRLACGSALARAGLATAAMDVSDGISRDLSRLCVASRTGAELLVDTLPLLASTRRAARLLGCDPREAALHGGEEYELLFTARPAAAGRVAALGRRLGQRMTPIGRIVPRRRGLIAISSNGTRSPLVPRTWEHFSRDDEEQARQIPFFSPG